MANQPKKYKKFVATAATATLVASAIVPVASAASFSDVADTNSHAEAINALVEAGIIKGYEDGTFKPNATLTRGHVVKMLGKWVETQGFEIPADYDKVARFTDLAVDAADQELVKYAALVKDTGVFNGLADGSLNAKGDITRENMALTLDRAYKAVFGKTLVELAEGVEDLTVTDLATAKAEAREAIQALRDLEISNVDTFNPKDTVKRGQFASFLHRTINVADAAAKLKVESVTAVNGTLTVKLAEKAETVVAKDFKVSQAINGGTATEVTPSAAVLAEDGLTVTLTVDKVAAQEATEQSVVYTVNEVAAPAFVVEATTPVVKSVTAVNGTTVEVKFTQAVDKTDLTNKVTIEGVTLTKPTLSEDGKTLTLTSDKAIKVTDATVVVEPIKTKADAKVKTEKYVGKMTYEDKVAPTIVSVEAKTNATHAKTATVKLSESVKAGVLVKVNGDYVTVEVDGDKLNLSGLNLEAGKTHTVEVINAEDVAGNKVVTMSATFTVAVDSVVPVATVSAGASDKEILVTFNKSMKKDTVKAITVKDETLTNVSVGAVTEVPGSDNKQFTIAVTDTIYTNKDSRTFSVVLPKDMEDELGNKTVDSVQTVTLTKDSVKPVATGYNVVKDADGKVEAIEVNFSEKLKASSPAFGSVVNENGVIDNATFAGLTGTISADGKTVVYTFSAAKEIKGKFAVSFAKDLVTDTSEVGNKSDAFNFTIDFGQGQLVNEFEVTKAEASSNVITVTYPEAVKGGAVEGSATDIANYTLGGKPLPEDTKITLKDTDQKVAIITLPAETVVKDDKASVFTVANVKNVAGNKTVKSFTGTVEVNDNVAPVLQSAKILDNKTIELTYSENIALENANLGESFKIVQGTETLVLSASELTGTVASGFENKLVLKLAQGADVVGVKEVNTLTIANAASTAAGNITVTFNDGGSNVEKTVAVEHNDTAEQVATKVAAAFSSLDGYTVTTDGAKVVFTANKAAADKTVTVTVVDTDTTGVGTPSATQTTAGVAPSTATTLDLTKDITIETLNPTSKVVTDKSTAKNEHKKEVKVTVVKP